MPGLGLFYCCCLKSFYYRFNLFTHNGSLDSFIFDSALVIHVFWRNMCISFIYLFCGHTIVQNILLHLYRFCSNMSTFTYDFNDLSLLLMFVNYVKLFQRTNIWLIWFSLLIFHLTKSFSSTLIMIIPSFC